jgi:hypothetical protein
MSRAAYQGQINQFNLETISEVIEQEHLKGAEAIIETVKLAFELTTPENDKKLAEFYKLAVQVGRGLLALDLKDILEEHNVYGTGAKDTVTQ